jgi:soluble lytic murein transglycosylase-like protein
LIFYVIGAALVGALIYSKNRIVEEVDAVSAQENWTKFDALFKLYGAQFGVPWEYLKAIALNESSLGTANSVALGIRNPYDIEGSKSYDGLSWGLMQVTIKTARGLDPAATEVKLNNPEYSIKLAAKYIGQLQKMFSTVDQRYLEWVIKSYNQGPGNSKKERDGKSEGFAQEYWDRFQRNLERVSA